MTYGSVQSTNSSSFTPVPKEPASAIRAQRAQPIQAVGADGIKKLQTGEVPLGDKVTLS